MLKENPRPVGCKKLTNQEGYRIRIGNYRILYTIEDENKIVMIYRVGHRRDVYR
jgi:mRNA interferase RelE/StbE